jgi:hypothetical protein
MRTKFIGTATGVMATLALAGSPAAAPARTAELDLEDGGADRELDAVQERAAEALQAVVYRLSVEGAGGSDAAAEILSALLDGESPSDRRLQVAGRA